MPRIVFSMARDGLIFKFLAQVSEQSNTPVIATILSGILSSKSVYNSIVPLMVDTFKLKNKRFRPLRGLYQSSLEAFI